MQLEEINAFGVESFKRAVARFDNVFGGEIVTVRRIRPRFPREPNTAFRRDQDVVAHPRILFQNFPENALSFAVAINIRVIEERIARVVSREDSLLTNRDLFFGNLMRIPRACQSPATITEQAALQGA